MLSLGLAQVCAAPTEEKSESKVEHFTAVAMGTGGAVGGRSMSIDIHINEYTTDEEVLELSELLKEKGQDALRLRLEKVSRGRISPSGRVGNDLAVIRARPIQEGKRRIFLATARVMPWLELYISGRSRDYDIGMIILEVNNEGRGEGTVIAAGKLEFNEEGVLEVESFGNQYVRLVNVRRWD